MPNQALAFIGLGAMGSVMARRLVVAGFDVRGSDTSPRALDEFEAVGGQPHALAADAVAGAETVILMLPGSPVVEAVVADVRGALAQGALIIDMSSSEPRRTQALAEGLRGSADLIDAPVSGGVAGARAGTLTIMAGGRDALVERARPVLEHLGSVRHAGPVGSGHALKALNNVLSASHLWLTSEMVLAGQQFGMDPHVMLEIINGSSGRSGSSENKLPRFILPGTFDSGFALRLMLKDMRIARDLAAGVGVPSVLVDAAVELWERAAADLPADADHTEVARWIEAAYRGSADEERDGQG